MAHLWVYKNRPKPHAESRYDRRSRTRPSKDLVQPRSWADLRAIYGTVLCLNYDDIVHETHPDDSSVTRCLTLATGRLFLKGKITCITCLASSQR